jgi:tRNA nucleotidyltransferase (CCA-adding enzyme)
MHIILTHEQADFDAMGALLASALLLDGAHPVLPHKTNRNVRAFLSLYGAEMPFVEARDLPAGGIDQVTLVDTQSLVTLKGVGVKTQVNVIDHHQRREDLPVDWQFSGERVGSCTTILVESLRDHNGALNPIQATLMLLGIYEDTGSLTYAGTTARDARAAAYLLENSASLRIASTYLNPPLSIEQRKLYDQLLAGAESHTINGQHVMLATANAEGMAEEVSAIAHKLRDLLEPDALFLLVTTDEGIRMVARSTTDGVNVARVAAHFGGGGHERAAAALIHPAIENNGGIEAMLVETAGQLLAYLPKIIQPAVTVGKIMSRQPLVLTPKTTAQEAGQMMQRYGYEGYPVVENGKVIGLLTRRSVDRAHGHKLNLPAASLMDAGTVTIRPEATLDELQQLMATSGWGQIPVVDDESELIGIVTRTDLLKTLEGAPPAALPGRMNLATKLEAALPPARLALLKYIAEQAHEKHLAAYIVGGFVRDLILDRPGLDFDIVVEGDAIGLARRLEAQHGGRLVIHSQFGTAKWEIREIAGKLCEEISTMKDTNPGDLPEYLDLISARTEFYDYPTALPTVERSSIKLDLHRRDFTINTLALRLDGRYYGDLYDYWGGLGDLQKGVVRVLHSLSFVDDPTRMMRAIRFEQRFGFKIDQRTLQLMDEARPLVRQVSGDRLRHELNLILAEEKAAQMLVRLKELDLLSAIHPEIDWDLRKAEIMNRVLSGQLDPIWKLPEKIGSLDIRRALGYLVWFSTLPAASAGIVTARLRLNQFIGDALTSAEPLRRVLFALREARPSQIVAALKAEPLYLLYVLHLTIDDPVVKELLLEYTTDWCHLQSFTSGDDLRKRGLQPGPIYKRTLWRLRSAWLDGEISTREEEEYLLRQILAEVE